MLETTAEIYEQVLSARRPFHFFGDVDLEKAYKKYVKIVHPDRAFDPKEKYIANECFIALTALYNEGLSEIKKGVYKIMDTISLYRYQDPLFSLDIKGNKYDFYEHICDGDVASVFRGISDSYLVYLKVALDQVDNGLIDEEYKLLQTIRHGSVPFVERKVFINDCSAIIMHDATGTSFSDLMNQYSRGIPAEHVMWILERLFSIVGYLHSQRIIHGNIKPEHLIIDKLKHNVSLLGFSWCIQNADTSTARYRVINEYYTAPEVTDTALVLPSSDIYSVGKVAVELLGGDIKSNGMPITIDSRVRKFIRSLVELDPDNRPNDAWKLWDEVIQLRTEVYGTERFKILA